MKSVLIFNLPEDEIDHKFALEGRDWYLVVWDLDQRLRELLKYGNDFKSADEALEDIRGTLHQFMIDYNLTFEGK